MSIFAIIVGGEQVQARFLQARGSINQHLTESMARITIRLQAHVVRDKLSGQVLHFRTNNLRGSIHQEVTGENGTITGKVGTNVEYAAFHEYGFHGTETVKAHLRTIRQVFGRPLKSPKQIAIRQHSRAVDYPEHSFLRSALEDMRDDIKVELSNGVKEAIK